LWACRESCRWMSLSRKQYFALSEDRLLPSHCHLTEAVHVHGAKMGIQLCLMGSQMNMPEFGESLPVSFRRGSAGSERETLR